MEQAGPARFPGGNQGLRDRHLSESDYGQGAEDGVLRDINLNSI